MNKNVLIAIIAVVVVAVVGVAAFMLLGNKEEAKSLDLAAANQTLSTTTPFNEMAAMDITTEELSAVCGIDTANVEKVYGKMPMMNVHASMYLLIEAKEGKAETVKAELDKYVEQYEQQWSTYLPEQYEYVKNRKEGVLGNTVYLIIAENSEALEKSITE